MNNKVTKRQHEYLKAIEGNPQSSIDVSVIRREGCR